MLVIPKRVTPRLADLTPEEVSDLFMSVQTIGRIIEKATSAKSLTIACQVRLVLSHEGLSVEHSNNYQLCIDTILLGWTVCRYE